MTKAKTEPNYEALRSELDTVMFELQRDDLDVDKALEQYERGLELVKQLEQYLQTAENKIQTLKASFDASATT